MEGEPITVRKGHIRWLICALLFGIIAINYVDRQVLSVLKPTLQGLYGWTESGYADVAFWFQAAYGVGYVIFGRVIDRVGARTGGIIALTLWSIAHTAHVFFTSTRGFALIRVPLAFGEAAMFPVSIKAISDWFPRSERAFAIGIFNAGTSVGAIVAPFIVPIITIAYGWQMAFIITGIATFAWLGAWLLWYRTPRETKGVGAAELAHIESEPATPQRPVSWSLLLRTRQTYAYILGRFCIDPVWWTFLFWLPDFFARRFDLDLRGYGPPLIAVYVGADIGSVIGGWHSSHLLQKGYALNRARKLAMLAAALFVVPVAFAQYSPNMWIAVALIALACAGHQGFVANLLSLPADLFPRWAVGSVLGLGGLAGALGGMIMAKYAGWVLETLGGDYTPIFVVGSVAYLVALGVVHLVSPRYEPTKLVD
jgi:ACS family hexuronate transporter-like MFS transporter